MSDPLLEIVETIRQAAKISDLQIFFGRLSEFNGPMAQWNDSRGGDWEAFLACATTLNTKVIYLNWNLFEQDDVDQAISAAESELLEAEANDEEAHEIKSRMNAINALISKIGSTCLIDLAFVTGGVAHTYRKTADWYDEFENLLGTNDGESDEESEPADRAIVDRWARELAANPKYFGSKNPSQREYLLEKISGEEFTKLPVYEIFDRAETIFQMEFRQAAEEKLAEDIKQLKEKGLNLNAIAQKLGIPRDRVSGLLSAQKANK